MFRVLALRQRETANAQNVRLYTIRIGSTPTFLHFDVFLYNCMENTEIIRLLN